MKTAVLEVLPRLSWSDYVDVLAVAAIIYYLLSLLSGTRAANLLKGIGLVFVTKLVAIRLHMYSLTELINGFMTLGVAALVIIFQPELRRALEHLGRGGLLPALLPQDEVTDLVLEIEHALLRMSSTRTGALIVIEQRTGLKDWCETGVAMGSQLSARLLLTIFHHLTPLHDGAVVISRYRLEAASCFLPLSQSVEQGLELGTRHRAAIGITEVSDAVALVCSEETGRISWVEGGKMTRGIAPAVLRERLCALFGVPERALPAREAALPHIQAPRSRPAVEKVDA